ncbi:MAG: hypothetical protein RL388_491, partial [Actinomycetota bacterium]
TELIVVQNRESEMGVGNPKFPIPELLISRQCRNPNEVGVISPTFEFGVTCR